MSPWWTNLFAPSCDVLVTSHELVLSQAGKNIASVAVAPTTSAETLETRVTQAFRNLVNAAPYKSTRNVNVWLSHSLAAHSVVRLDARTMNATEIATTVKGYWEDTLGTPASALAVAYQVQSNGQSVVTSSCQASLVSSIQAALQGANWTSNHMAPHIGHIWNANRKQIGQRNCCLLILQDNVLSIGLQHSGQWAAWTSEGCESHEWSELSNRVTRFCRSTGLGDPKTIPVWVHAIRTTGTPNATGLNHWSLLNTAQQSSLHP